MSSLAFVDAEPTVRELRQKTDECDQRAAAEPPDAAAKLREEALLCRRWAAALRAMRWTA